MSSACSKTACRRLETRFKITVSGKGREEVGQALPAGFVPVALSGDLNARFDGDGTLTLQVRGEHWLTLVARAGAPLVAVQTRTLPAPWPEAEIWSYRAQTQLRVTEAEGAPQIDPALAEVAAGLARLAGVRALDPGQRLGIAERSRGLSQRDQNRLHLNRTLWLDHDGDGCTARDQVSGRMLRDWRLDFAPPFKAMRASENGEPVLITEGRHPGFSGVELRSRDLNLSATARLEPKGNVLPATGWQQAFESVQTTLSVPPVSNWSLPLVPIARRRRGLIAGT
ncbi:MAG: hypothetical protein IPH76_14625 [Xanthomonadales bacterium]|nr:hypothetical protein [Xanthomonadales bacterium]